MEEKMKHRMCYTAIIIALLLPSLALAVSNAAPIFLLIEPGSRPGAMGSAYVAHVDDGFSAYWNTGAMAFNRKTQFAGMHSNWFGDVPGLEDMYFDYFAWNQYFEDLGNIGFNITFMSFGKQDKTGEDGEDLGTFSSYELAAAIPYSYQINETIGVGLSFKFIFSDLAPRGTGESETTSKGQGMSFAFDLGFLKKNLFVRNLSFGINLQNLGPNITYINESQSDPLPLNYRMGLSYRALDSIYSQLTINADMSKVLANDDAVWKRIFTAWKDDNLDDEIDEIILNIGAEYVYLNLLALRAGYYSDRAGSIDGFSFGAGVQHTFNNRYKAGIDFAMQPAGELTDYNKTFSVKVEF
jgi:hypothetical protein